VYVQDKSPYYWIRIYDKLEEDKKNRARSINSKIRITPGDLKRIAEAKAKGTKVVLRGNEEIKRLAEMLRKELNLRFIEMTAKVKLERSPLLSEALEHFILSRSVPGKTEQLAHKSLANYRTAVQYFINACGDREPFRYTKKDYDLLLYFFESVTVNNPSPKKLKPGELPPVTHGLSTTTRAIYVRTLKALWNHFIKERVVYNQIFGNLKVVNRDPETIPLDEMEIIFDHLKHGSNPGSYQLVRFLYLTGCRVSSAMVQLREDIDLKTKLIKIVNVKTGARKGNEYYQFPIYPELEDLLIEVGVKPGESGRLFSNFALVNDNYSSPLSFWKRAMKTLLKSGRIRKAYTLKMIRSTAASRFINDLGLDIFQVKKLLDHSDIRVTEKNYINFEMTNIRKIIEKNEYNKSIT
jgi:integrase